MKKILGFSTLLILIIPIAQAGTYKIDFDSPHSWEIYYQRIGLGTVTKGPFRSDILLALEAHCQFLTDETGWDWIPLGYSIERGYKLCYRTGPYFLSDAKVMCARLEMQVREQTESFLICDHHLAPPVQSRKTRTNRGVPFSLPKG